MRTRTDVGMLRKFAAGGLLIALASSAVAQITGTKHDLSGNEWGTDQICIFCHTPHGGQTGLAAPLWNHATTVSTYQLYTSTTLNATTDQPGDISKLCLSCHDGTVAVDSFGGATGSNFIAAGANLGTDLAQDHPVGFTYDAALATADTGLVSPASATQVVTGIPLFATKLECASCHNVHSNTNAPFLRASNAASALCLKCHLK